MTERMSDDWAEKILGRGWLNPEVQEIADECRRARSEETRLRAENEKLREALRRLLRCSTVTLLGPKEADPETVELLSAMRLAELALESK